MIKQLSNSVIAKYCDLSMSRRSIICLSLRLRQIIDLLATDKSQYFAQPRPIIVNCRSCSQTLFFGGGEATTANTSAARRLQSHLKSSKLRFIYSCKKYCLIRIKLNFVKHLKIKISEKSSTQGFDVAMTSLLSDKDKTKN